MCSKRYVVLPAVWLVLRYNVIQQQKHRYPDSKIFFASVKIYRSNRLTPRQAGAFAAFTVDILVYPLDTLKTRVQSPDYNKLYTKSSTNAINRSLFRGLYQGIGSVVLATIPSC